MNKQSTTKIKNIVCIGDTHCGSQAAIMPPGFRLRDGQTVEQSPAQIMLWHWWLEFWSFVDRVTHGEPYVLIHNGDQIDGAHHSCVQLITNNVDQQRKMFVQLMRARVKRASAFYCLCGTAAHVGQSSADEEAGAEILGAVPDKNGNHVRQDLWIKLGDDLIQFAHHIGTTSSQAYKSSPAMRLMAAMYGAAGEWGFKPPTIMIRNHAHDYVEVKRPNCRVVVCPAWQLKSDWMWGKDTASLPIIGGLVIKQGDEGVHIREFIRTPKPSIAIEL
jgi:hypothetical protein